MQKDNFTKFLPVVLVLITLVLGISYFHESAITTDVRDEVNTGLAAPEHKSEIPY